MRKCHKDTSVSQADVSKGERIKAGKSKESSAQTDRQIKVKKMYVKRNNVV